MSIHVSEPGRPVGTRLPEIFRGRRVGNVSEVEEPQRINVSHSEATDAEFLQAENSGRHRALEQYGAAASGEHREQRPYLPVSKICTPMVVSVPAREEWRAVRSPVLQALRTAGCQPVRVPGVL